MEKVTPNVFSLKIKDEVAPACVKDPVTQS